MMTDWFLKWSTYQPEKVAIDDLSTGKKFTYKELNTFSNTLAHSLKETYNLTKGDRVLVLSTFVAEYLILLGVAQKLGIILVPINYRLSPPEVNYLISNSEPSLLIAEKQFQKLLGDLPNKNIKILDWDDITDLITSDTPTDFEVVPLEDSHPCMILYTSGTTGFPKGAIYTHGMMAWNSLNTAIRLKITTDDITLMVMPPFHTGGWNVLTTPLLHFGGTVLLMPKFEAATALKYLEERKVTIFMAVPTMVKMMNEDRSFQDTNFSAMRYMIVGGEALPIAVIDTWAKKGVPIRQGYGLTEAGPNITSLEATDAVRKRGSIGFPNFYVQSKLVKDDGTEAGAGEKGELWLKGPMVTPGYWKNVEATKKSFTDGWFRTGDILIRDHEGFFYVVDRIKNMYISGGENVYPAEVEKRLSQHIALSEAVVIPVPDEKWGEVGKAYVVVRDGHTVTANELISFCLEGLAKFKVPRYIEFMEELPKNDTGKIDRKALNT